MIRGVILPLAASLAVAFSGVAQGAGQELPVVLKTEMGPKGSAKAFTDLEHLANCLAKDAAGQASTLLGTEFPSTDAERQMRKLVDDYNYCLSRTAVMKMNSEYLRGALIEATYRHHVGQGHRAATVRLGEIRWANASAAQMRVAACVASRSTAQANAVVWTKPASRQQFDALARLKPSIDACAAEVRSQPARPQLFRFHLAEALYRQLPLTPSAQSAGEAAARRVRLVFRAFADCVVKQRAEEAKSYILSELDQQQTARLRGKMLDDSCWRAAGGMEGPIQTTGLMLQGTLAEALLAAEGHSGPLRRIDGIADLTHQSVTEAEARQVDPDTLEFMRAMAHLFQLGECVARANVDSSYTLLKSEPGSVEETAAFAGLRPAFEGCTGRGQTSAASTAEMRAAVAVNYYRLAHAPRRLDTAGAAK